MTKWIGLDKDAIDAEAAAEGDAIMQQFRSVGSRRADGSKGRNQGSERRARQSAIYNGRTAERFGG